MKHRVHVCFLVAVILIIFGVLVTASRVQAATMSVSPTGGTFTVGNTFDVSISLDTVGAASAGADVHYLNYDPTLLEVVDANTSQAGVQITPGTLMPVVPANSASNGRVAFSQVTSGGNTFNGNGTLATIRFRVLSAGAASVTLDFTSGRGDDANVASGSTGVDLLTGVTNGSYTLINPPPPPQITINAIPSSVQQGQSSILSWSVSNATSCTASNGWSGSKSNIGGNEQVSPSITTTYTLTCTGTGGMRSASATITVGSTGPCHRYTSSNSLSSIPAGFGVPWDIFDTTIMTITANCDAGGSLIEMNKISNSQYPYRYVYKNGYYIVQGATSWTSFTMLGAGLLADAWFPSAATTILSLTPQQLSTPVNVVGYLCGWTGSAWKCGCRDAQCVQSYWQLQKVQQ